MNLHPVEQYFLILKKQVMIMYLRSDNDINLLDQEKIMKEEKFMDNFNENDYLDIDEDDIELIKKALDLETLIVERLARDKNADARRIFGVLKKLYNKFDNDHVKDIYFRVLLNMPKEQVSTIDTTSYSYRNDKNNFKEILNEFSKKGDIKAFNEN